MPAFGPEQSGDPAITVSTVLAGQADDIRRQRVLVWFATGCLALGRSVLTDNLARAALRDAQFSLNVINALPAAGGA